MIPTLHHPVPIVVTSTDHASTIYDANAREEIQIVGYDAGITIAAQMEYREFASHGEVSQMDRAGLMSNEAGYALVRAVDLATVGWTPKMHDRITSIAGVAADVYITRIKPAGHYPAYGPTLFKLYFEDRKPARG